MLSDYRILQRIGRAESTGEHYVNRLGHSKQKTVYREYLITSIGQLTKDEWFQKAYAEMVKENKMELIIVGIIVHGCITIRILSFMH